MYARADGCLSLWVTNVLVPDVRLAPKLGLCVEDVEVDPDFVAIFITSDL
jgi:hypothetical protein